MRLRWLLGNFTDPQYKLTRKDQKRLSQLAHEHYTPRSVFMLWTWTIVLIPPLAALLLLPVVLKAVGMEGRNAPFIAGVALIVALFWPYSAGVYGAMYVRPIRRAMRHQGYDLCIYCGYDLRGVHEAGGGGATCPECGRDREVYEMEEPDEPAGE